MKNYLFTICLAAAICSSLYGEAHSKKHSDSSSSESSVFAEVSNASAQDTTDFDLTMEYQNVLFSQNVVIDGSGIQAISPAEFQLEPGTYQVTYSGVSFFSTTDVIQSIFNEFALSLDNTPVIEFQTSGEPQAEVDTIRLVSFTVIVPVATTSVMSIQAKLDPVDDPSNEVTLQNRTLCIVKLQ